MAGFKLKVKTRKNTVAFDKFKAQIEKPGAGAVYVGILQEDQGQHEGLAKIATENEFGVVRKAENGTNIVIPPRPFIRSTMSEETTTLKKMARIFYKQFLAGKITKVDALETIGIFLQGRIRNKIVTLKHPKNAPLTIALKGEDNPLVDTGLLGNSINFVVRKK